MSDVVWIPVIHVVSGYDIENVSLLFTSDDYVDGLWSNYTVT